MFPRVRGLVSFGNVVLVLVLVFAMSGGAYAAKRFLITSTKQISPGVLKQLRGKAGAAGVQGPAGGQGPVGLQGPGGALGAKGENGMSVTGSEVPKTSGTCEKQGGSEFTSATGKTAACNGKEGSPWVAGGTLPSGSSEVGEWSIFQNVSGPAVLVTSVGFGIPLKEPPVVVYVKRGASTTPAGCVGSVSEPGAEKGHLCIFAAVEENSKEEFFGTKVPTSCPMIAGQGPACLGFGNGSGTADSFGFSVMGVTNEAGGVDISGTWAVTGE